jgi:hypothetical protein
MATPPPPVPGLERPFQQVDFPLPDFRPPTRKEERTITQKNQSHIAIAEKNFRFLGLHLLGLQAKPEVSSTSNINNVSSSTHFTSSMEGNMGENLAAWPKSRPTSDAGVETSWEQIGGQRWGKRTASDSGSHLQGLEPDEMLKELHSEVARALEHQKKQEANLQTTPPRRWRSSGTPPMSRTPGQSCSIVPVIEEDEEENDVVQDAPDEGGEVPSLGLPPALVRQRVQSECQAPKRSSQSQAPARRSWRKARR